MGQWRALGDGDKGFKKLQGFETDLPHSSPFSCNRGFYHSTREQWVGGSQRPLQFWGPYLLGGVGRTRHAEVTTWCFSPNTPTFRRGRARPPRGNGPQQGAHIRAGFQRPDSPYTPVLAPKKPLCRIQAQSWLWGRVPRLLSLSLPLGLGGSCWVGLSHVYLGCSQTTQQKTDISPLVLHHVAQDCRHRAPTPVSCAEDAFRMTPWPASHTQ